MHKAVITTKDMTIGYPKSDNRGGLLLRNKLSLKLYAGELTCLLGTNGVGKSTLLRTLGGMQAPLGGELLLDDKPFDSYTNENLSQKIGFVLTDKTSVGGFTVSQLVALGRYPYTGFFGRLSNKDHQLVKQAMEDVSIAHKADSYVAELSDGERQRAMIAKALVQECPILFLDEPSAFLDVVNRFEIMNLLHQLAFKHRKTILLTTHDTELALLFADRLWLLSAEKGLETGVTEDILLNDTMTNFLTKGGIVFDKKTGGVQPAQAHNRFVYLEADGSLYHWAANFLRRNNWGITRNQAESTFMLTVISNANLVIKKGETCYELDSFEALSACLRVNYALFL